MREERVVRENGNWNSVMLLVPRITLDPRFKKKQACTTRPYAGRGSRKGMDHVWSREVSSQRVATRCDLARRNGGGPEGRDTAAAYRSDDPHAPGCGIFGGKRGDG
jgi:hypothetical protein